jgi:fructokinase
MNHLPTVVGLGEVLWDLLPSGRKLGGAPANFAYCSHLLGNRAVVASRVGADELGSEVRESLLRAGVTDQFVQIDPAYPTGTVNVQVDEKGQPKFAITQPVAWDFMEWTETWEALAQSTDAVCFGSLAQRSEQSRRTILQFLEATRRDALRVFDVNLRQAFYSAEIVKEAIRRTNVVKLNHEELPLLQELLDMNGALDRDSALSFCRELIHKFDLQVVCITQGSNGSLLCDRSGLQEHPGFQVRVKDTVGAGDAFTATLVFDFLRGLPLAEINKHANAVASFICSQPGATAPLPETLLQLT